MIHNEHQTHQTVRPLLKICAGIIGVLALLSSIPSLITNGVNLSSLGKIVPDIGFALIFLYYSLSNRARQEQTHHASGSLERSLTAGELVAACVLVAGLFTFIIYKVATK
jgi:hypothetical protein